MIWLAVKDVAVLEGQQKKTVEKKIERNKYHHRLIDITEAPGKLLQISLSSLSLAAQERYWSQQLAAERNRIIKDGRLVDNEQLRRMAELEVMVQKALNVPDGWAKQTWVERVAKEAGMHWRTMYTHMDKMVNGSWGQTERKTRNDVGQLRQWDDAAIKFFTSTYMANRHLSVRKVFILTENESERQGWRMGSERSAYRIVDGLNEVAQTFRRKGWRGVEDEVLPPIMRNYSDLNPNDIWVGDQHTFDWFVQDENSGRVFRPQGYIWQDLRSRGIAGASLTEQYDSYAIGLALRDGILKKVDREIYGIPKTVYTDWGKPERANFLNGFKLAKIEVTDINVDFDRWLGEQFKDDLTGVYQELNIKTRQAIVRNSKAKLIERTFQTLEGMLRDRGLKGWAGNRVGVLEEPDKEELKAMRKNGSFMGIREFFQVLLEVIAEYNNRDHRGMGMNGMSPNEVFRMANFLPRSIDRRSADILFMKPAKRKVSKRGVVVDNVWYHDWDRMIDIHGKMVELRYDPFRSESILVFFNRDFVCEAPAYAYGSMVNEELTRELIAKKRHKAAEIRERMRVLCGYAEDYEQIAQKAVTRFDKAARELDKGEVRKKEFDKIDQDSVWKILAETNRSVIFNDN